MIYPEFTVSKSNMRKLKIGQTVHFDHIALPEYDEKDNRTIKAQRIKPMIGKIVGIAVKREGQFHSGTPATSWNDGCDGQADLSISKDIKVWEVKTGYRNKVLHVFDEHANVVFSFAPLDIPYCAPKPTIINEVPIKED